MQGGEFIVYDANKKFFEREINPAPPGVGAHVAQDALVQLDSAERRDVVGQRALLIGASVDVIEQLARQSSLGGCTDGPGLHDR